MGSKPDNRGLYSVQQMDSVLQEVARKSVRHGIPGDGGKEQTGVDRCQMLNEPVTQPPATPRCPQNLRSLQIHL
jgi:hypothetical protein